MTFVYISEILCYSIECLTVFELSSHCIFIVTYISHVSFSDKKSLYRWHIDNKNFLKYKFNSSQITSVNIKSPSSAIWLFKNTYVDIKKKIVKSK